MDAYRAKILDIEKIYLKERVFTLSSLSVKLSDYFYTLPELDYIVSESLLSFTVAANGFINPHRLIRS